MVEKLLLRLRKTCSCVRPRRDGSTLRTTALHGRSNAARGREPDAAAIPGGRLHIQHPWRLQALRSLLFNTVMFSSVTIYALLSLLTWPFPSPVRYGFISQWARFHIWLLGPLCGLRYRVEGGEHLPQHRTAVVLSKHQSSWETLAFQQIFPPQVWVLKQELLWVPFFGWGLALLDPIAINRGAGRRAVQQIIEQGRQRLETERWVVVFPEGTRIAAGQRRRFGIGGAALAAATGHPVVPVAHNAGYYWPRRGFHKKPGTIQVVIGPIIETQGRTAEEINRLAETWINETMTRLEAETAGGAD